MAREVQSAQTLPSMWPFLRDRTRREKVSGHIDSGEHFCHVVPAHGDLTVCRQLVHLFLWTGWLGLRPSSSLLYSTLTFGTSKELARLAPIKPAAAM